MQMVGKKTKNKAVGISKDGRNTKIHVIVDGLGNPISFLLSAGNEHDSKHASPLLRQVDVKGSNILGDRAYNAKEIRDYIIAHQASYTIPPKKNNPKSIVFGLSYLQGASSDRMFLPETQMVSQGLYTL